MSRTLFWEEEVPGRTQLLAAIVSSEMMRSRTFYEIQLKVSSQAYESGPTETRTWSVKRRYSEFDALHKALHELGFPCPSLPPKQLWGGHTSAFMINRQNALNCWIQGVVIIWQSVAPARPRVAYAIGELLEAFLCSPDSESFYKVLEEVQNEEKTATDQEPEIEASLPALGPSTQPAPLPESPFVSHMAAADKARTVSWSSQTGQPGGIPRVSSNTSFAQVAQQNRRRSKRSSGTSVIAEDQASSFSDVTSLIGKTSPRTYEGQDTISRSAPPQPPPNMASSAPAYMSEWAAPPPVPSVGAVGIAINMISSSSPNAQTQRTEYVTFNNHGERVKHSFLPFTAKVMFGEGPEGREEVARTSGIWDACTPVSVPPTPHALNQFTAQWNQYTSSVLEFVQERLSIVSKNKERRDFNILDRHNPGIETSSNNMSDNEDDDNRADNVGVGNINKPLLVINLRDKYRALTQSETTEPVEDADAGAGGSAQGGQLPPKHALAASYVLAGEHLIKTILREAEADMVDWQFVSNTKDVVVMRRLRPIKKKNLLRIKGPSVLPSPSPTISDDRARGNVATAPSMLVLDGASSVASSVASSAVAREPSGTIDVDSSQHCFMGRGIIDASAEEIFELVRRPEKRHLYDAMLNEELLLENLAVGDAAHDFEATNIGNLLVYYHLFETNRCFLRYARDFCVVQYAKKVMVGKQVKYVVVGASINHARCPVREDVERATLDLFGWVIEPTTKPKQSKVTYMMHIDFGRSGVPTHLLNTISFRQPLLVHYLRRHIQSIPPEVRAEIPKRDSVAAKEDVKIDGNATDVKTTGAKASSPREVNN